jgi:hypothetical protein
MVIDTPAWAAPGAMQSNAIKKLRTVANKGGMTTSRKKCSWRTGGSLSGESDAPDGQTYRKTNQQFYNERFFPAAGNQEPTQSSLIQYNPGIQVV